MMELFEIDGLVKKYGQKVVLDIPRLKLESDRIYALLGPNGAGKSTLLRILNLLEEPDSGTLKFMGADTGVAKDTKLAMSRQMCMVFQRPYMFNTTVFNNVAYGLKLRKLSGGEVKKRVLEALAFVGLADFFDRPAKRLSGGEMQRVALARALVLKPRVLLLDEPTANLDPHSVQAIEEIVKGCRGKFGASVIIVTHNLFQAKRMAEEVVLLFSGRVVVQQKCFDFFDKPGHPKARAFLDGTMVY